MSSLADLTAVSVGNADELYERQRRISGGQPNLTIPKSDNPRGLAIHSLQVADTGGRLWGLLDKTSNIYLLSVSFDLSGSKPLILPPKEVPDTFIFEVEDGETLSFTLGDGLPLFPATQIMGGLITYIVVSEADKGVRHAGEVIRQVHEDLSSDGSVLERVNALLANPSAEIVGQILSAAAAALQPIGTILRNNGDDSVAAFSGIFPAKGPWADKLSAEQNGTKVTLAELGS